MSELQQFASGATRSPSRLRYDLVPPTALRALAERFGVGAEIHGEMNWLKGIPFSAMVYHMQKHLEQFKEGCVETREIAPGMDIIESDVENLAAIMWGAAALIHFVKTVRIDLDDRPYKPGCAGL